MKLCGVIATTDNLSAEVREEINDILNIFFDYSDNIFAIKTCLLNLKNIIEDDCGHDPEDFVPNKNYPHLIELVENYSLIPDYEYFYILHNNHIDIRNIQC